MLEKHLQKLGLALVATAAFGLASATNAEARVFGGFHAGGFPVFHAGGFRGGGFGFRGAGLGYRGRGWGWRGFGAGVVASGALAAANSYAYGYPSYPANSGYGYSYPAYGYPAYGTYGGFGGAYAGRFGGAAFATGHRFVGNHAGFGRASSVHAGRLLRR
jgi:hypothetical protein